MEYIQIQTIFNNRESIIRESIQLKTKNLIFDISKYFIGHKPFSVAVIAVYSRLLSPVMTPIDVKYV